MNKEFKSELDQIIKARKAAYRPTPLLLALLASGAVVEYFLHSVSAIFGIIAFIVFYKKIAYAARLPCPRCRQPFGAATRFPLGSGSEHCQNCGLSLSEQ